MFTTICATHLARYIILLLNFYDNLSISDSLALSSPYIFYGVLFSASILEEFKVILYILKALLKQRGGRSGK